MKIDTKQGCVMSGQTCKGREEILLELLLSGKSYVGRWQIILWQVNTANGCKDKAPLSLLNRIH